MILISFLKTIQVGEIHLKFQGISRRKNAWKRRKNYSIRIWMFSHPLWTNLGNASCAPRHALLSGKNPFSIFFFFFLSWIRGMMPINRNFCTHFKSIIKLAVQGKVKHPKIQGSAFSFSCSLGYIILFFCNGVCYHL